ncbi:MAG: DUF5320 domain-containing protein [Chitinivibrionales bacterium]|nr:DUF5320 domain-containing protein [Chitinivibrionales bacterium]
MPRGDGTGPGGRGPMTGRAGGFCAGNAMPGFMTQFPGRNFGIGRGRGLGMMRRCGWSRPFFAAPDPVKAMPTATSPVAPDEIEILKNQAKYFSEALDGINKRIAALEQ